MDESGCQSRTRGLPCIWRLFPSNKRHESIPVWHPDLWQRLCVDHIVFPDDVVDSQEIRDYRVDLIIGERFCFIERHGTTDVIENRCRVGPEASDSLERHLIADKRVAAARQRIIWLTRSLLAMTGEAFCDVDGLALFGCAAAGRQACAIRSDADVPRCDFFGCGNTA